MAREMAAATSHVHLTGWFLSPELALSREEEPLVVRTLLAELAERIDVRVLLWKGAPIPAFRPSRGDVREMEADTDASHEDPNGARFVHRRIPLPSREDDRDRRSRRVRRRDRPHGRRRRSVRHAEPPRARRHRLARRRREDRRPVRAGCRGALPASLAERSRRGAPAARRAGGCRRRRAPDRPHASRRRLPRRPARRLLDSRVVRRSAAVSRAHRVPREPVPVVTGDRRHPRRQVARSAERRIPRRRPSCRRGRTTAPTSLAARWRR